MNRLDFDCLLMSRERTKKIIAADCCDNFTVEHQTKFSLLKIVSESSWTDAAKQMKKRGEKTFELLI